MDDAPRSDVAPRSESATPSDATPTDQDASPAAQPVDQPASKRKRWPLFIVIGALVLACACVAGVGVLFGGIVLVSSAGPNGAVTRYYDAVRAGDYATAHAQLTPGFAAEITPDDLRDLFTAAEAEDGPITGVSIQSTRIEGDRAAVDATIQRERAGNLVTVQVLQSGDTWLIDDFASP